MLSDPYVVLLLDLILDLDLLQCAHSLQLLTLPSS